MGTQREDHAAGSYGLTIRDWRQDKPADPERMPRDSRAPAARVDGGLNPRLWTVAVL